MITQEIRLSYDKERMLEITNMLISKFELESSKIQLYDLIDNYLAEMRKMYGKVNNLRFTEEDWSNLEKGYSMYNSTKYLSYIFNQMISSSDYMMLCLLGRHGLTDKEVFSVRSGEDYMNLCLERKPLIKQKLTGTGVPIKLMTL